MNRNWGTKQTCTACESEYFDLGQPDGLCPMCNALPPDIGGANFSPPPAFVDMILDDGSDGVGGAVFDHSPWTLTPPGVGMGKVIS